MATSEDKQIPRVHNFELVEGMKLQINASGSSIGRNVRVQFQLRNCARTWILHWGFLYRGNTNWFIPAEHPKQGALQTPFVKSGEIYLVTVELRDPKIHAIEFVLKDGSHDRWLRLNHGNFRIEIPEIDTNTCLQPIPKDLIELRAYQNWERRGRPNNSPQQQQKDYNDALKELQLQLSNGISLKDLQSSHMTASTKPVFKNKEQIRYGVPSYPCRRHDVEKWLQKNYKGHVKTNTLPSSSFVALVENSLGADNVISRQSYHMDHEIVVLSKIISSDYHILVAVNMKGAAILHWGISKCSPGEWLSPPPDMLPEKSKMVAGACQTYFTDIATARGSFQVDGDDKVKWLLDEISCREKEAERSLMHRFNIAAELTERCKGEGELGLIAIMVWMSEISEAQDRFTNLLQKIYSSQPNDREIVRLIMAFVGRGGQGDVGQRIRDEILVIQRNNGCKTGMMEEWHQKLHNNTSPDDIIICEALLNYIRCGFKIDAYWQTLNCHGLSKQKLASYDRPIVSEPRFRADAKESLTRDLTMYLKTLKAVHSGADLESAIETCYKGHNSVISDSFGSLSSKLRKLVDSRIELHPVLGTACGRAKDLLFLDISLASAIKTTMERGLKDLNFSHPPEIMSFISLLLESLCLSVVNNEDLIYCTKDWYRVSESYRTNDAQWALQAKAILDRLQLVLAERSQTYQKKFQPSVKYLGCLLGVEKYVIDNFTEELVRAQSEAVLSILINRFEPVLRKVANLGCWQVISPVEVCGFITSVNELITLQNKVYRRPTIIIASRITGEEEIPVGVVAVLTSDMPDVLSHVCFATCFDQNILRNLRLKEGKAVSIRLKSTNLIISDISSSNLSLSSSALPSIPQGITFKRKIFRGKYAVSVEDFAPDMVGAKSCNIKFLRGRVPSWIKIPTSVAIPFGAFETVLSENINKDIANKISRLYKFINGGDLSKLQEIQEAVLQMSAPLSLIYELKNKMRSSGMPWPGDEGWNLAWRSIKKVWASKWNERAFISCRKANLNHDNLCMAVLIQETICGDYAFVIHTKNPLSGDNSEIYTEIVKGLGETLVGAYPGRAMSFVTKKNNLKSPIVTCYPSKLIGLYGKPSIIFRSDSNGEDLEKYAGAGLYDSVIMNDPEKVVLDYSRDPMVGDKSFQTSVFSKIAETGKIIESLYGYPQDIEGVLKDGSIYVVQARPQM
ncbi:alpha-glucan water dikinase 2 [Citrus sinensis]|uniref:Alpha-glucan water dikinase 2 n=1 Tax=Citrus sinensis TaxID=2711 RepID=A0ACB8NAR7_CITSI|nr:alpha-glucan water dikinase 2 [Citrus sinensis]